MAAQDTADDRSARWLRQQSQPALMLAVLGFLSLLVLLLGVVALFGQASDGEPIVRLDVQFPTPRRVAMARKEIPSRPASAVIANPIGAISPSAAAQAAANRPTSTGAPVVQQTQLPPAILPAKIAKPIYAGGALVADPALIEPTASGPLPRIADDGRTPMTAYAPVIRAGTHPRIALVVTGLGISAKETSAALDKLPPLVTLAFAPYADDVQRWVSEARRRGHEVLLEVPMEPYDFPDSDPGPHTLRAAVSEESNAERLSWSLTRFSGYAGITNLLGGRFMADSDSVSPVMTFLARRGLLFFDSGPEGRTGVADIAKQTNASYVQSEIAVDTIQTAMEIDARLSDLETRARTQGTAAGTGFVYPVTIARVSGWASGLSGRGFVLVPASAIVANPK